MGSLVLGVDPGINGAFALFDPDGGLLEVEDIPVLERRMANKKVRRSVDGYEAARLIDAWSPHLALVMIEQVNAMPSTGQGEERRSMGAQSAFNFGEGYGLLRGICLAHFHRVETVTPQVWRKAMGVKGDKDESRARASQLWPTRAGWWNLKKHSDRAEAALIACYGARLHKAEGV